MAKKNQVAKVKNLDCLNCGYPFFGNEVYCPECGQKNKNERVNFGSFLKEVFNGFTSWDAKFWRTLFPLLTKPGKVSKDYIEGKRARYTNPFRFYLTTSILFFLLLGLGNMINDYRAFSSDTVDEKYVKNSMESGFMDGWNSYDDTSKKEPLDSINKSKNDSIKAIAFGKDISKFVAFQNKHPNMPVQQALDSLNEPKTFFNKFFYKKSKTINGFSNNPTESMRTLISEATSHISTAIFILLPLFALFLKLLYFRRKYTYVEHLIFVFHTQTVFFILLILFSIIGFFFPVLNSEIPMNIVILLFLIYLFIAMKVFYEQGYFKTILKYLITITAYSFIAIIGSAIVTMIAFTLM